MLVFATSVFNFIIKLYCVFYKYCYAPAIMVLCNGINLKVIYLADVWSWLLRVSVLQSIKTKNTNNNNCFCFRALTQESETCYVSVPCCS